MAIEFLEAYRPGYGFRTNVNCRDSSATLAVYATFNTAGEKLTRRLALEHRRAYCPINVRRGPVDPFKAIVALDDYPVTSLNFAGNGIYTVAQYAWSQDDCDTYARELLAALTVRHPELCKVRSGGQTGFDEAGVKAAAWLGLSAVVYAPKGWVFRNAEGQDINDEALFKARFNQEGR